MSHQVELLKQTNDLLFAFIISKLPRKGDREVLTENKLVACACEDGFLRVASVRARKTVEF